MLAVFIVHFALVTGLSVEILRDAGERLNIVEMREFGSPAPPPKSRESPDPEEEGGAAWAAPAPAAVLWFPARGEAVPNVAGREQRWWLGRD